MEGTSNAGPYSSVGGASVSRLVRLEKLRLTGTQFLYNRDAQTPQYSPHSFDKRAAFEFDWNVLGLLFMENRIHLETLRTGEVKTAGWHWIGGMPIGGGVEAIYEHHSQHILDEPSQINRPESNKFPVEDSWGLRITIYENKEARGEIFK